MEIIRKPTGVTPTDFEVKVAQELKGIFGHKDFAEFVETFKIAGASEVEVVGDKKAIVVFIPMPIFKRFKKIQSRVTSELEKKFDGRPVVFIGKRTILGKGYRRSNVINGPRPYNRTISAVHDAILDDLVFPSEIVGKHTRLRVGAGKEIRCYLGKTNMNDVETKLDTFRTIYSKLTNKSVVFEFTK